MNKKIIRVILKVVFFPIYILYFLMMMLVGNIMIFISWVFDDNTEDFYSPYKSQVRLRNEMLVEFKNYFTKV